MFDQSSCNVLYSDLYSLFYSILDRGQADTNEDDKTKLKFANVNLDLMENKSWMEKVFFNFFIPLSCFIICAVIFSIKLLFYCFNKRILCR